MTSLLSRLRKNTTKTKLKELNGIDTTIEREEFADIMCDVLSQMDRTEHVYWLQQQYEESLKMFNEHVPIISSDPIKAVSQIEKYIDYLIDKIDDAIKEKHTEYTCSFYRSQFGYAVTRLYDYAKKVAAPLTKEEREVTKAPYLTTSNNNPSDILTLDKWIKTVKLNRQYLTESIKEKNIHDIYEACGNYLLLDIEAMDITR